ncbi:PREDICTED: spermatogenesis-associated protein 17-like [Priapulus caudatus]|uniref:Spermatogenesis-associated protein 17-like n=1 Tax=Priapulus caudatus TaxID=37621 RepID=A0ABM1ENH5_PRICU|nr:PREDICTED: spermatogenesis-associated protein 17-like [Priapulus caudatus]
MATYIQLLSRCDEIIAAIYTRSNEAQIQREKEYRAAVKVQSWFRGLRVRAYLRYLNDSAVHIQKIWRGYVGRKMYRQHLAHLVANMKQEYYNSMAFKIQKIWRGYYTRKYIFNFYQRRKYLDNLQIKNEVIRNYLEEYHQQKQVEETMARESELRASLQKEAEQNHHLVSTAVKPGIYGLPSQPRLKAIEERLLSAKRRLAKTQMEGKQRRAQTQEQTPYRDICKQRQPLPPVGQKIQGPFKPPAQVYQQRYKTLQPTLRLATSFTSEEETRAADRQRDWTQRVNDNIFLPFSHTDYKYEPLLHSKSKYGSLPYGTKYFRELDESKQLFQTVVPPIPIFEKLGKTYSDSCAAAESS